jgi:hypothetical protein
MMKKITAVLLALIFVSSFSFAENTGTPRSPEYIFNKIWNPTDNTLEATVTGNISTLGTISADVIEGFSKISADSILTASGDTTITNGNLLTQRAAGITYVYIDCYDDTAANGPYWNMRRSHNDTLHTRTTTLVNDKLGTWGIRGTDAAGNFDFGVEILVEQVGTSGNAVPAKFKVMPYSATARCDDLLVVSPDSVVYVTGTGHTVSSDTTQLPEITVRNTNNDDQAGNITFQKNGTSPAAGDSLGLLQWEGEDTGGTAEIYGYIQVLQDDASVGSEDVRLLIRGDADGTDIVWIDCEGEAAGGIDPELCINESSVDMDFRIESDNKTQAFFVEGSTGNVSNDAAVFMPNIKSGANQGAAGAAKGELWHDTDDDTIKLGV